MVLIDENVRVSRRRGDELEAAILDGGWDQLVASGYGGFTFEAIAERVRTSKPVLYRRWSTREELLLAVIRRHGMTEALAVPDTGSLREDVLALLSAANREHADMAALFSAQLAVYYQEGGLSPAELRREILGDRPTAMSQIIGRAVQRGEVNLARLTPRAADLPFDLLRHEVLMTLRPVSMDVIREIVDDVFLPLVRS